MGYDCASAVAVQSKTNKMVRLSMIIIVAQREWMRELNGIPSLIQFLSAQVREQTTANLGHPRWDDTTLIAEYWTD